jgi:hypothetical protein
MFDYSQVFEECQIVDWGARLFGVWGCGGISNQLPRGRLFLVVVGWIDRLLDGLSRQLALERALSPVLGWIVGTEDPCRPE